MEILLQDVWKRYTVGWVLKDIDLTISPGQKLAIRGNNGSGKSTLIQIISGYLSVSKGKVSYDLNGEKIDRDHIYKHCAISAAYAELDEELSVAEIFDHYRRFKPFKDHSLDTFLDMVDLRAQRDRPIRNFSSGMKQRLSLGLAFSMNVPLLILDEPTSFLDKQKKSWYSEMIEQHTSGQTVVIASNDDHDVAFCDATLEL